MSEFQLLQLWHICWRQCIACFASKTQSMQHLFSIVRSHPLEEPADGLNSFTLRALQQQGCHSKQQEFVLAHNIGFPPFSLQAWQGSLRHPGCSAAHS